MHRYRTQALRTASDRNVQRLDSNPAFPFPSQANAAKPTKTNEAGGLSIGGGGGSLPAVSPLTTPRNGGHQFGLDGGRDGGRDAEKAAPDNEVDAISGSRSPAPAPSFESQTQGPGDSAIEKTNNANDNKLPMTTRMKNGSKRFGVHLKNAIFHSWVNVLLVAVPAGIAADAAHLSPTIIFAINAVAIVPLAGLLAHATECVASRLGTTWGALLNVSFGNSVELIIFIIALVKDEIRIVQASLLGSILANLLLILGMAFLLGGLRFREQIYNSTVTQMSACLLSLSVMSLLLPTAFHASFNNQSIKDADHKVLQVSRGTSVVLLIVYILYLLFQLKSHAYMYESTPQEVIDEESHPGMLHNMMNSPSSSDSSSSSSSSDSESSASGSVATAGQRVKRIFKHRKRRKSSASTSTTQTTSHLPIVSSSPSTERPVNDNDFLRDPSQPIPRRKSSTLAAMNLGEDADADGEDNGISHVFDWAKRHNSNGDSKSPVIEEPSKRKKGHSKKKDKKRRHRKQAAEQEEAVNDDELALTDGAASRSISFAPEAPTIDSATEARDAPSKLGLNVRNLSSRYRPALPTYLSNTVFSANYNQPASSATPAVTRPVGPIRSISAGRLRRTNSLPDRLNERHSTPAKVSSTTANQNALSPYQQQRLSKAISTTSGMPPPPAKDDEEEGYVMSRTAAVVLLLGSTVLVAVCAEFMVDAIPGMIADSSISEAFVGLIILPIVGNAAEHVTAVTVAAKNKMDLAIGVAVGSSIQIALFVTPVVVLIGWILSTSMSLYFNLFETICLFVTVFVVNFLVLDGRSNYLEGSLLIAAYVIIAVASFFYPSTAAQSAVGGGAGDA